VIVAEGALAAPGVLLKEIGDCSGAVFAFVRELWVCFRRIQFHFMLEDTLFIIYKDHKPCRFALRQSSDPWTVRKCSQMVNIAKFMSDIHTAHR
jgi:hypothetical protein